MPNSMLDWPDATQTSPTKTSVNVRVLFPTTVRVPASLLGSTGFKSSRHVPSAAAVVVCFWLLKVTVIFSPGDAQPQTGSFDFSCKTMWSPKIAGRRTSALAVVRSERQMLLKPSHQKGRQIFIGLMWRIKINLCQFPNSCSAKFPFRIPEFHRE